MAVEARKVWYRLVESSTGLAYRNTSASKVSVDFDADVADFRNAVQANWDKPGYLNDVPAGALNVYKNKEAFEKRNATEIKVEPLDDDYPVFDLGKSTKEALIVVVPSVSSNDEDEPMTKTRRIKEEVGKHFIEYLQTEIPTPSSFADHTEKKKCWAMFLPDKAPDMIISHRDPSEGPSVPVYLLSQIFQQFVDDLQDIQITSEDCLFVGTLTESMSGMFPTEQARTDTFIDLFEKYTGMTLKSMLIRHAKTDGSLTFGSGAIYCNLEVKVEKGTGGGDPYMQSIAYYLLSLPRTRIRTTQYPCFLLELYGTAFSVSGILNTDKHIICDPLCPTFQLYRNQEFVMMQQITKLFASLNKSLKILQHQEAYRVLSPPCSFPFLSSFSDRDTTLDFKIQYQKKIKGLVFSAIVQNTDNEVIIKFCSRYNENMHLYCHLRGFAPRLISHITFGNYIVVVMEKLKLRSLTKDDLSKSEIQEQIQLIAARLREGQYVHGDLRSCNILFEVVQNRVILLDFDWSGHHNVDVYPPFMNPVITWPETAKTGLPLLHEHDDYWLARLFSQ